MDRDPNRRPITFFCSSPTLQGSQVPLLRIISTAASRMDVTRAIRCSLINRFISFLQKPTGSNLLSLISNFRESEVTGDLTKFVTLTPRATPTVRQNFRSKSRPLSPYQPHQWSGRYHLAQRTRIKRRR